MNFIKEMLSDDAKISSKRFIGFASFFMLVLSWGANTFFGFDIKEPKKPSEVDCEYNDNIVGKMEESQFQILYEVHQLSKQFKYIDNETKVIFVRNRIPRTLIKSKIKPKASLIAIGGGYYTAGTDNLKRFLDSLPKTLYYNDHRPSSWEWHDNIIIKL